jgi:hypothetical protein
MPGFVSKAQRKKWEQLVNEGRVTQEQFDARDVDTSPQVPDRAPPRPRTVGPSRAADAAKYGNTRY